MAFGTIALSTMWRLQTTRKEQGLAEDTRGCTCKLFSWSTQQKPAM